MSDGAHHTQPPRPGDGPQNMPRYTGSIRTDEVFEQAPAAKPSGGQPEARALLVRPPLALVVAMLAALAVWGVLQASLPISELPEHLRDVSGNAPEAVQMELMSASKTRMAQDATLSLVLLAATLSVMLTAVESLIHGERLRAVGRGLLAGSISGGVAIGAGTAGAILSEMPALDSWSPLAKTMIVQGIVFGILGLGVGLGISLALFRPRLAVGCATGGVLGGVLAALLYSPAVAFILPGIRTELLMPDPGVGLLLWLGLAAGFIGLTVTGLGTEKSPRERAALSSPPNAPTVVTRS